MKKDSPKANSFHEAIGKEVVCWVITEYLPAVTSDVVKLRCETVNTMVRMRRNYGILDETKVMARFLFF